MKVPLVLMVATTPKSVIVGLNGALQKRFILPENGVLVPGDVHRASEVQTGVGGKGQDVAIALNCLCPDKSAPDISLAQFIGTGSAGNAVFDLLQDALGESAMGLTVRVDSEMRTCTSIVACDETTELVEPSGIIEAGEFSELMSRLEEKVNNKARGLCIMGSMPPGCAEDSYAQIYSRTAGENTLCVVDSVAGVQPLLKTMSSMTASCSTIFKINASELCRLSDCAKNSNEAGGVELSELTQAILQFKEKFAGANALSGLAITDGRHPGYFASFNESGFSLYKLPIATLESGRTLFPIGAGDAVAAGTLAAWLSLVNSDDESISGESKKVLQNHVTSLSKAVTSDPKTQNLVSAFAFGLACGSASCLQEENSVLAVEDVHMLLEKADPPEFVDEVSFVAS